MKDIWSQLRNESRPSKKFENNLRAKLYENASREEANFFSEYAAQIDIPKPNLLLSIEKSNSVFHRFKDMWKTFHEGFMRLGFMLAGGAIAMVLMVPLISFFTTSSSSASEPSFLRNIEGNIAIERMGVIFSAEENQELFSGDRIISSENSQLEIIFFEGTVMRMAENTQIEIKKITKHPFLFSSGGITVKLNKGKVWLTTFQSYSQGTGITLHTPNTTIYPEKSSLAAIYMEGRESILVMKNKAIVHLEGLTIDDNIEIRANEMVQFTPFDEFLPLNENIPSEWNIGWIAKNNQQDTEYTYEYLARMSAIMKEEYVMEELSRKIEIFLETNPNPDELKDLIERINTVMLISESGYTLSETLDQADSAQNEEEEQTEENTPEPEAKAAVYSQYIPKQTSYSRTQNTIPRNESINTSSQINENAEDNQSNQTLKTLEVQIEDNEESAETKTARELAEEHRRQEKIEKIEAASNSFAEQIETFEFESSRATAAQNIINKIPDTADNLELIQHIEQSAPADIQEIIQEKKIILEQAKREKEIKEYKESLKNAAPTESIENSIKDVKEQVESSENQEATLQSFEVQKENKETKEIHVEGNIEITSTEIIKTDTTEEETSAITLEKK